MNEPGIRTTDPTTNGCPPPKDTDKDGIIDPEDACPEAPGPKDPDPKKNGCPAARVEQGQIKILERVEFENNSAKIRPESDRILQAVLGVMTEHAEFTKLSVEGHTDNRGGAGHNLDLSRRRAASVMKWLTDHGVAKERLSSKGFGLTKPIDSNDTDAGRQNNRRKSNFRAILEKDGQAALLGVRSGVTICDKNAFFRQPDRPLDRARCWRRASCTRAQKADRSAR